MKKIFIILLFLTAFKAQSQTPQAPIIFIDTNQMKSYAGSYQYAVLTDTLIGGHFYTVRGSYVPDGINIISTGFSGRYWQRISKNGQGGIIQLDSMALVSVTDPAISGFVFVLGYHFPNDGGGGPFYWSDTSTAPTVQGMIIKFGSQDTGRWIRAFDGAVNIRWFGARGRGVPTLTDDTSALITAIAFLGAKNGGRLYFPNTFDASGNQSYYAFAGTSIWIGNNITLFGDGKGKSELRDVSPLTNGSFKGTIFLPSTYAADSTAGPFQYQVEKYNIFPASKTDTVIVLQDITKASRMFVGEVIMYGCLKTYKNGQLSKPRFKYGETNEITRISNDSIWVRLPLGIDIIDDSLGVPGQILNINNNAGISPTLGIANGTVKNLEVANMTLTQAQADEILDTTIQKQLTSLFNPGGMFNFNFHDLTIQSYQAFSGNILTYGNIQNVDFFSESKFFDLGYNSSRISFRDINFLFTESPASDFASALMILNDGPHQISLTNVHIGGDNYRGSNLITAVGLRGFTVNNLKIDFPNYYFNNVAFNMSGDSLIAMKDIYMNNVQVNVDATGQFMRLVQEADNVGNDNISFNNMEFHGTLTGYSASQYFTFTMFGITDPPVRNDQYSTNGSTYAYRGKKPSKVGPGEYSAPFIRISGSNDPLSSGTLTRVSGSGDPTISYNNVSIEDSYIPYALDARNGNGDVFFNVTYDSGRIHLQRDSGFSMLNVRINDSLILDNCDAMTVGVTAPTANTVDLGNALSIIGGIGYINGIQLSQTSALQQTYAGTDTWNGTPPSGSSTKTYSWVRNGNNVILNVYILYATPGATNTSIDLDFPADAPLPFEQSPFNSTNDVLYTGLGQVGTGTSSTNNQGKCFLIKTGGGTYKVTVVGTSVSARSLWAQLTYIAAND